MSMRTRLNFCIFDMLSVFLLPFGWPGHWCVVFLECLQTGRNISVKNFGCKQETTPLPAESLVDIAKRVPQGQVETDTVCLTERESVCMQVCCVSECSFGGRESVQPVLSLHSLFLS